MIDIILNILLVLLIIIGVLLGILLIALGVVLFVPVRYKAEGSYKEKFRCTFSISWILKIFQIVGAYNEEEGFTWKIKLFYRTFKTQEDLKAFLEDSPKEAPKDENSKSEEKNDIGDTDDKSTEETNKKEASEEKEDNTSVKEKSEEKEVEKSEKTVDEGVRNSETAEASEKHTDISDTEDSETEKEEIPKKSLIQKIKDKINEIKAKIREFKTKTLDIWDKIKYILLRIDDFIQFAKQDKAKKEFRTIGGLFLKVLKHMRPKVLKGRLLIGTGEPDKTGIIIGMMCVLYGIYGEDFAVTADFENKVIETDLFAKGHFNLFLFLWVFIRILCQKNLMVYIFNLIKNEFLSKK